MIKKISRTLLVIFLLFTAFSFWTSPRLGGIIPLGKEKPDQNVEILEFDTIPTKNYGLIYKDISPKADLIELKETYKLDTLVQNCKSDFDKVVKIQSWVQSRWKHDGNNPSEKANALYILNEVKKGRRFRCVEYSIVANQCLSALGFKVRGLGLMTKDISEVKSGGGHVVNEIYLDDIKKWVFIDPQFDVITTSKGTPLNAIELQNCIANSIDFELINPNKTITKEEYRKWIGPYLYYFYFGINGQEVSIWDRIVENKKQLTLLSKNAKKPKYFQKIFRINNSYYTNSIEDFYPTLE